MGDVVLALRGLWFRRWVSLAVLVVSSLVVGGAVTGPLFLRAAGESVLRDNLNEALPIGLAGNGANVDGHWGPSLQCRMRWLGWPVAQGWRLTCTPA